MDETTRTDPPARRVTIPGGTAALVAEAAVEPASRPGEQLVLQALAADDGTALLRFGYRRNGRVLRGPVAMAPEELRALLDAARPQPALAELLAASP